MKQSIEYQVEEKSKGFYLIRNTSAGSKTSEDSYKNNNSRNSANKTDHERFVSFVIDKLKSSLSQK